MATFRTGSKTRSKTRSKTDSKTDSKTRSKTRSKTGKPEAYERYAELCLDMVGRATLLEDRVVLREMAAEWLNLAGAPGAASA
jgi:hypothetical protein